MIKLIGFNFSKIYAEKTGKNPGKVDINSNIDIKDIKTIEDSSSKKETVFSVDFVYDIKYGESYALLSFSGTLVLLVDEKEAKDILKEWKSKEIKGEFRLAVFNAIFTKSNIKALQLEQEIGVPPHIPLPRLGPEGK